MFAMYPLTFKLEEKESFATLHNGMCVRFLPEMCVVKLLNSQTSLTINKRATF